jgi:hypothetical protein
MWFFVLSSLLVSAVSFLDPPPQHSQTSSAAVYAAVLADPRCSGLEAAGGRGRDVVVVREAVAPASEWWWNAFPHEDFPAAIPKWLPGIQRGTLESFLEVSSRPGAVDEALGDGQEVKWISREEIHAFTKGGDLWQEFYKRHPSATGLIELSAVGFGPDRREALVYCGRSNESLSGRGFLVFTRSSATLLVGKACAVRCAARPGRPTPLRRAIAAHADCPPS